MANFRKWNVFFRYVRNVQLFNFIFLENCIAQAGFLVFFKEWNESGKAKSIILTCKNLSNIFHPDFAWLVILDVGMDRHFLGLRIQQSLRLL